VMGTASHEAQLPVLEDIGLRAVGQLNVREIRTSVSATPSAGRGCERDARVLA
jgi:hypothetical protein